MRHIVTSARLCGWPPGAAKEAARLMLAPESHRRGRHGSFLTAWNARNKINPLPAFWHH
jgi:hypothetical protein